MRALIVYASWFGHNRTIAKRIANDLTQRGMQVICAPITRITASDTIGCDLLVLGSFSHAHHASWRMRHLIETIPERRIKRMAITVFGTQTLDERPSGIDDLIAGLNTRGVRLAVPPLRIILPAPDFAPWSQIAAEEQDKITQFVQSLRTYTDHEPIVVAQPTIS